MITTHSDVVGSLLRPPYLLKAREDLSVGAITDAQFKAIEDRAVREAIRLQEEAGLEVITDGEMRRLSFQSQFTEAVDGLGKYDIDAFLWGNWHGDERVGDRQVKRPASLGVIGKLVRKRHLSSEEFTYLRGHTTRAPKITLPSPSLWANFWSAKHSITAYPTLDSFLADVVVILREEVTELVRLGATYIQIDAPHYTSLLDPETRAFYEAQGWTLDRWLDRGIEMDNALMQGYSEVTFGFHLCRGNQGSRWLVEGGYDLIAKQIFQRIRAQRLLLEYDDERSGSFAPLIDVSDDKMVVLGLITTKSPRYETPQELTARIREASRFVDLERLALSPQCGFSTSVVGNRISVEDQRRKLGLVVETAKSVWT
ncbi:MAG TPA: cobalamin-independent methionine synthase II family protein [Blastocatellia bacterium]|nr:cobalamin-independent methionine synthase II family protein [Blastocatellia bacterium]